MHPPPAQEHLPLVSTCRVWKNGGMPTDLQIIDAFERLREQFGRENPAFPPPTAPPAGLPAEHHIVEAWLLTQRPRYASGAAGRRRLRALSRAVFAAGQTCPPVEPADRDLHQTAARFPALLQTSAARNRLPPIDGSRTADAPAEELAAWSRLLPNLGGLNGWRFLARLGRPVIVPEAPIRRLLWRFGLIEEAAERGVAPALAHGALQRVAAVTGLPIPTLAVLVRWTTTAHGRWSGGGWCAAHPRCAVCPLRDVCAWARYHPAAPEPDETPPPIATAAARRLVAESRQDQLPEIELVALLLPARVAGQTNRELAEDLLQRFGGLRGLERASVAELCAIRGISTQRATTLKTAFELGRRLAQQALQPGDPIRGSQDVWQAFRTRFRNLPQEHFVILLLDNKNRVIQDHVVSKGSLTASLAHPREVFHQAVRQSAAGIILLHNHPSGDPTPSREDREVTSRLREAGEILGIRVLDHIILGADDYFSFTDQE
jgi:DNA repair protein RadC